MSTERRHPACWFLQNGIGVFPVRPRGKEPLVKWLDYTCTPEQAERFGNYGVRLTNWLGVLDSDSPETEAWVAANIPVDTPFRVVTARGVHRYFRLAVSTPKFLHRDGLTIEFRNEGQYVIGPGSTHSTGAVYTPDEWSWNLQDIPFFPKNFVYDDGSCGRRSAPADQNLEPYAFPDAVASGARHHELFKLLRQFKGLGSSQREAWDAVVMANELRCRPPLKLDGTFKKWFIRGWENPDRPMDLLGDRVRVPYTESDDKL